MLAEFFMKANPACMHDKVPTKHTSTIRALHRGWVTSSTSKQGMKGRRVIYSTMPFHMTKAQRPRSPRSDKLSHGPKRRRRVTSALFTIVCTDCYSTLIDKRQPSYARILASLDWYDCSRTATGFCSSSNAKTHDEDKLGRDLVGD